MDVRSLNWQIKEFFAYHPWLSASFSVTASTPLDHIVAYFTDSSDIQDLTQQILSDSGRCSLHPVARGGLADVYRVILADGTSVAVKCLRRTTHTDSKELKRAARELITWSRLEHQNVLEFRGLAKFQGCLAMVSPWMEHGNVIAMTQQQPHLNRTTLCIQLAAVISHLHKIGVVHGDLKGDNILISSDGTIKLTDFGLSIAHNLDLQFSETDLGGGTLRWMAPELLMDIGRRCQETDVYALGMTMLEIITSQVPFYELHSPHAIFNAVVQEKRVPERPQQLLSSSAQDVLFWTILHRCWAFEPERRARACEIHTLLTLL